MKDLLKKAGLTLTERPDYQPAIAEVPRLSDLSPYEADALIGSDAAYGEVVCRCESVSEAELLVSLDGEPLKRRKLAHVQPSEMVSFSLSREELPSDLKDNRLEVSIT